VVAIGARHDGYRQTALRAIRAHVPVPGIVNAEIFTREVAAAHHRVIEGLLNVLAVACMSARTARGGGLQAAPAGAAAPSLPPAHARAGALGARRAAPAAGRAADAVRMRSRRLPAAGLVIWQGPAGSLDAGPESFMLNGAACRPPPQHSRLCVRLLSPGAFRRRHRAPPGASLARLPGGLYRRYLMAVARVIEISSTSNQSFEHALLQGVERANKTLRNVVSAWVKEQRVQIREGRIAEYQVNILVTFILEGSDTGGV
jgi:flavin-binding protein dodecin